jgi:hypothetical protein
MCPPASRNILARAEEKGERFKPVYTSGGKRIKEKGERFKPVYTIPINGALVGALVWFSFALLTFNL